jgi:hypothetical protein
MRQRAKSRMPEFKTQRFVKTSDNSVSTHVTNKHSVCRDPATRVSPEWIVAHSVGQTFEAASARKRRATEQSISVPFVRIAKPNGVCSPQEPPANSGNPAEQTARRLRNYRDFRTGLTNCGPIGLHECGRPAAETVCRSLLSGTLL